MNSTSQFLLCRCRAVVLQLTEFEIVKIREVETGWAGARRKMQAFAAQRIRVDTKVMEVVVAYWWSLRDRAVSPGSRPPWKAGFAFCAPLHDLQPMQTSLERREVPQRKAENKSVRCR